MMSMLPKSTTFTHTRAKLHIVYSLPIERCTFVVRHKCVTKEVCENYIVLSRLLIIDIDILTGKTTQQLNAVLRLYPVRSQCGVTCHYQGACSYAGMD